MALHKCLNNFTGGELSPLLDARVDLQKYDTGCRQLFNFRVMPWGGVTRRSGTLFINEVKDSTKPTRLIPFNVSTEQGYAIELGEYYARFYLNGARVTSSTAPAWTAGVYSPVGCFVTVGGVVYRCVTAHTNRSDFVDEYAVLHWWVVQSSEVIVEVATPFAAADLFAIQFRAINDVIYFVHPNYTPQKLRHFTSTAWDCVTVGWKWPVFLDENTDDSRTLQITTTAATALVAGIFYRIVTVGSTNFTAVGASANTVGVVFQATGAGTGTGTAFQLGGGGATLLANTDTFFPGHENSAWELRHLRDAQKVTIDLSVTTPGTTTSDTVKVKGDWTFVTTERWYGTVDIERSIDGGVTWEKIRTFTSASDRNVNASGTQDDEALFRVKFTCAGDPYGTPPWTGAAPTTFVGARGTFETASVFIAGYVIVQSIVNPRNATVYISQTVEDERTTATWSEGAWSTYRGFPRAVGLFEQRLYFGGTKSKPNTLWGSVVADFENFLYSELDDAAVAYQFASAQQNPLQWLISMLQLHAGTSGGEHIVSSGNLEEPLTPSNVTVRDPTGYGSEYMQALKIDNAIVFLQRQGRRIRELREMSVFANPSDAVAPDLALLAEHVTASGITQMDFARTPDPVLFAVMGNGQLATMAYNREQNINAWSRYVTQGNFESVAVVYGSPSDVAYVIVNRTIGGQTKRYVEVFTAETPDQTAISVYADAAVTSNPGTPTTIVTGLGHLEGMAVDVVAGPDGHVVGDGLLVVSGGAITLPSPETSFIRVGLNYRSQCRPMKIDQIGANGTSQGRRRRISELCLRFKDTLGGSWGNATVSDPSTGRWNVEIDFRDTVNPMDSAPPLFTGDKVLPSEATNDLITDFSVWQIQPLPMTILGLFAKMELMGE